MKTKHTITFIVLCSLALGFFGYEYSWAKSKKDFKPVKIGVVSIRRVFENSKKNTKWQEDMDQERRQMVAELEKIATEIKAIKADMDTRKPGSTDYQNLMRNSMEKESGLEAKEKFYQQHLTMKEHQWTEQFYLDTLAAAGKVAEELELDLVLAKDENEFPVSGANELMMIIKTSKIMYNSQELDVTNEVIEILDKNN
ncbi:MAG: OmpH family outer membrane protein [Sedimentisphaerales bacterium]|nr:OmpH family outer membrane protein [Sedimentisphaerales bacterium]